MLPSYHHLILIPFRSASTTAFDGKTEFARSSTGPWRKTRGIVVVIVSCWSGGIGPRWTVVCDCTIKYAKRTRLHVQTSVCVYTHIGYPGYKSTWNAAGVCVYFRSIWLKTGDKSSYRSRPKTKELWQPSFPSFLPAPRSATSPPFLTSSNLSYSRFLSVLFFTFLLLAAVIGFFLYSVG